MVDSLPPITGTTDHDKIVRIETMMETVYRAVMGNGQMGLIAKVTDHDARLKAFDVIYEANKAVEGPLMQEWGAFKDKVAKLEREVPGVKERKVTGLAAYTGFALAVITAVAGMLGIPLPVVK